MTRTGWLIGWVSPTTSTKDFVAEQAAFLRFREDRSDSLGEPVKHYETMMYEEINVWKLKRCSAEARCSASVCAVC